MKNSVNTPFEWRRLYLALTAGAEKKFGTKLGNDPSMLHGSFAKGAAISQTFGLSGDIERPILCDNSRIQHEMSLRLERICRTRAGS
ncbi:MAG: hypothetical protein EA424_02445 [Planctomycetaceae bacterium]|nr:MAG: hypothetical protein EA424_02445 [Planctomycetaceae bacterium]